MQGFMAQTLAEKEEENAATEAGGDLKMHFFYDEGCLATPTLLLPADHQGLHRRERHMAETTFHP